METISRSLLTFLINCLWQVPLAAAVAALVCRCLKHGPSRHRHTIWVAALAAAILLPVTSVRRSGLVTALEFPASLAVPATGAAASAESSSPVAYAVLPAPRAR